MIPFKFIKLLTKRIFSFFLKEQNYLFELKIIKLESISHFSHISFHLSAKINDNLEILKLAS